MEKQNLLRVRAKIVKLGNTVYVHIMPLILEDLRAKPGDWVFMEELPDGSLRLEIDRRNER